MLGVSKAQPVVDLKVFLLDDRQHERWLRLLPRLWQALSSLILPSTLNKDKDKDKDKERQHTGLETPSSVGMELKEITTETRTDVTEPMTSDVDVRYENDTTSRSNSTETLNTDCQVVHTVVIMIICTLA